MIIHFNNDNEMNNLVGDNIYEIISPQVSVESIIGLMDKEVRMKLFKEGYDNIENTIVDISLNNIVDISLNNIDISQTIYHAIQSFSVVIINCSNVSVSGCASNSITSLPLISLIVGNPSTLNLFNFSCTVGSLSLVQSTSVYKIEYPFTTLPFQQFHYSLKHSNVAWLFAMWTPISKEK